MGVRTRGHEGAVQHRHEGKHGEEEPGLRREDVVILLGLPLEEGEFTAVGGWGYLSKRSPCDHTYCHRQSSFTPRSCIYQ